LKEYEFCNINIFLLQNCWKGRDWRCFERTSSRIDGCRVFDNVFGDCLTVKN